MPDSDLNQIDMCACIAMSHGCESNVDIARAIYGKKCDLKSHCGPISSSLERLIGMGAVSQIDDPEDRRKKINALTPDGGMLVKKILDAVSEI